MTPPKQSPAAQAAEATKGLVEDGDPSSALYGADEGGDSEEGLPASADPDDLRSSKASTPDPRSEQTGVTYVVLEGVQDGEVELVWREITKVVARNAEHAARIAAEGYSGTDDLTVVAIPERSWRPLTVSVKIERAITVR